MSSNRNVEVPGFGEGKRKTLQHKHFSHTVCYDDYPARMSYGKGARNIGERPYHAILILRISVCIDDNSRFGLRVAVIFECSKSVQVCSFCPETGITQPHFVLVLYPSGNSHPMLPVRCSKKKRGMLTWTESDIAWTLEVPH